MEDLTTLIEDSITDVEIPATDLDTPGDGLEASPEPVEALSTDPVEEAPTPAPDASLGAAKPVDDFDKKFGLSPKAQGSDRENRIPYSRVKKITEKAIADAKSSWQKETESAFVPATKYRDAETKLKDYEGRLTKVGEFEQVMTKEHVKFLQFLNTLPGYAEIFEQLKGSSAPQVQAPEPPAQPVELPDEAPQPDQQLSDGSRVYSMEGLAALRAYDRAQVQKQVMGEVEARVKAIEARYAPIENDYKSFQRVQEVRPLVDKQIADARTWPLFNESEADIVNALAANKNWSLERAYQAVVVPKMKAEQERLAGEAKVSRESLRAEILKELKTAPRATSTTTTPTRSGAPAQSGPRSLEDVISDSIKGLR